MVSVAPARERGLKSENYFKTIYIEGRSREGAWIEIMPAIVLGVSFAVAPARERGLKFAFPAHIVIAHTPSLP